jgi:hypothetical protein
MDFSQDEFDDPALRSAIRSAVGKPSAPPHLREKVTALLASARDVPVKRAPDSTRSPRSRWRIPQVTPKLVALAACVLIAIGFAGYELYDFLGDMYPRLAQAAPTLSTAMTSSMIASHDALVKSDHQAGPTVDFASIRARLTKEAGFAAFAGPLGDGWEFKDARVTSIDGKNAAQVMFVRNGQAASVFSIPIVVSSCSAGTHICETVDKHPLAATMQGNVMYAVAVTSTTDAAHPLSSSEAEAILATVTQSLSSAATAPAATQH